MTDTAATAMYERTASVLMLRVLVVDDTPDIRFLLRFTLERDGIFEVVDEAGDGAEAIRLAAHHQPDVVLLDLAMPKMDGLEALPHIRVQSPESKIVVLSGFNAGQMSAQALSLGAASYMEKGHIADRLVPHILTLFPDHEHARSVITRGEATPGDSNARRSEGEAPPVRDGEEGLVSVLAHELDNPVTVLQGFAMTLQGSLDSMSPETLKQSAEAISRASKHLGALIEAFSDMRNIEVDALDLVFEATDLSQLVRETITDMAEVTRTHPVVVEVVDGVIASIDPSRVRQVLINLLANAAQFAPAGTRIEVSVAVAGRDVEISVRDHGTGIHADELSELFRKFSRFDPEVPGTGIGLYLSRGIARAHGGDLVLAESSAPGCRFALRLPLLRVVTDPETPVDR